MTATTKTPRADARRREEIWNGKLTDALVAAGVPPHAFTRDERTAAYDEGLSAAEAAESFAAWYAANVA